MRSPPASWIPGVLLVVFGGAPASAQTAPEAPGMEVSAVEDPATAPEPRWQGGGFVDLGYALDFNHPSDHLFRSRATTPRVDELQANMLALYARKPATPETSRWGLEVTLQAGKDSDAFAFSPTAPNVAGARWLRHFGPTSVSYLVNVGGGLALQAGLFNSLLGYDSLYAKDNFTYTRPWAGDSTPYLMFGVNASYPFTPRLSGTLYVINGYAHLADANGVPSSGGQVAFKATDRASVKETILYGPQQGNTAREFWRLFSDTIVEWKGREVTAAFEYQIGAERVAAPGTPRAHWSAAQLPVRWHGGGPWSATVRPEFCRDRDGRWTGEKQWVKAVTTTVEYRIRRSRAEALLRLEHRYDESRGPGGGFFDDGPLPSGLDRLKPTQQLLILALIVSFESPRR